jgi:hypothetical protein
MQGFPVCEDFVLLLRQGRIVKLAQIVPAVEGGIDIFPALFTIILNSA